MRHKFTRGFTLIELLVVVLIIGILASIAVPQYKLAVHKSRLKSYMPVIRALANAEELYYMKTGAYVDLWHVDEFDIEMPAGCLISPSEHPPKYHCGNQVTLVNFISGSNPLGVGLLYCYDGSQSCTELNYDIRLYYLHQNQTAPGYEANAGKWLCGCLNADDKFCKQLCKSVRSGLN